MSVECLGKCEPLTAWIEIDEHGSGGNQFDLVEGVHVLMRLCDPAVPEPLDDDQLRHASNMTKGYLKVLSAGCDERGIDKLELALAIDYVANQKGDCESCPFADPARFIAATS